MLLMSLLSRLKIKGTLLELMVLLRTFNIPLLLMFFITEEGSLDVSNVSKIFQMEWKVVVVVVFFLCGSLYLNS